MFVIVEIGRACKHNNYKTIITKCFVASQTSMNVILQMEDVNTIVLTPLEAPPAAVMRDICWIRMGLNCSGEQYHRSKLFLP